MLEYSIYLGLFLSAFGAASLLPLQSEAVLVALLLAGEQPVTALLLVASLGNVLGAVLNAALGRGIERFHGRRWFPVDDRQLARAKAGYQRYGRWSLLLSWMPVIGDPLTLVAGVMREPWWSFLLLVTLAKAGRYLALAAITLGWF
ncbi:YqaA family protein [Pseudomonas sp. BMS12]|uniref:YqaA family protein n=1 Tax=Pseudomonas sp. BMS12 TaxID=1796033 RepID=UPI00083B8015|nr:YqaA family protein [Pseudomonas sp. BMS12]